jgi:proliferating cell nuclear antigen
MRWKKLFKIKLTDARLWRNLIATISTLIDEGRFNADQEGIKLREMDPSHVAMVDFEWSKNVFDEYECDEPTQLCINFHEMLKFLRRVKSKEALDLNFNQEKAQLDILLKNGYSRKFSMATLEPTSDEVPTPKIAFDSMARITTSCLKDSITDVSTVSDEILFEAGAEKLTLKAQGGLGSVTINIEKDSEELLNLSSEKLSTATYSINYLQDIIKTAANLSDIVTIEFSSNMPIRLRFELPQQGRLQYYLAPRVETSY